MLDKRQLLNLEEDELESGESNPPKRTKRRKKTNREIVTNKEQNSSDQDLEDDM
jgi:hypothetical protein